MNPLVIGIAALLLFAKKTVKAVEKIQIEPNTLVFEKDIKKFRLRINIINPTNQAFKIDSVFLTIANNNKKIGTVEKFQPFDVSALGRSTIDLPVVVSPFGLGQFLADTLITKITPNITVKGDIRYKGLSFPVSESIDLNTL